MQIGLTQDFDPHGITLAALIASAPQIDAGGGFITLTGIHQVSASAAEGNYTFGTTPGDAWRLNTPQPPFIAPFSGTVV